MSRSDVVDLWCALVIVYEQVKLDCRRKRGLAVLTPHNPEHFAILPQALCIDETEDNGQDSELEKLKLELAPKLAAWKSAKRLDEVNVLSRELFAKVIRVERVNVIHVAQHALRDLMHLFASGDLTVEDATEVASYRQLAASRSAPLSLNRRSAFH